MIRLSQLVSEELYAFLQNIVPENISSVPAIYVSQILVRFACSVLMKWLAGQVQTGNPPDLYTSTRA